MEDIKIALISPKSPMGETYHPPLGLCYLSSFIKREKKIEVNLFDLNLIHSKKLRKELFELKPEIVGITCFSP